MIGAIDRGVYLLFQLSTTISAERKTARDDLSQAAMQSKLIGPNYLMSAQPLPFAASQ
jgi:hypothetical protein